MAHGEVRTAVVSFAYVAASSCPYIESDERNYYNGVRNDTSLSTEERVVTVKLLGRKKSFSAQSQLFCYRHGDTMKSVYRAIYSWRPNMGNIICFSPVIHADRSHVQTRIERVLFPRDDIPEVVLCQELLLPLCVSLSVRWVVANFLVVSILGQVAVGELPVVVGFTDDASAASEMSTAVARQMLMSSMEESYLSSRQLASTHGDGYSLMLSRQSYASDVEGNQISFLFPSLEAGDLVCIDSCKDGRTLPTQAMIIGHTTQNGVLQYDVQCIDSQTLFRGLSCWQVVPL